MSLQIRSANLAGDTNISLQQGMSHAELVDIFLVA